MKYDQVDLTLACPICHNQCVYATATYSPYVGRVVVAHGNSCGCTYTDAQAEQVQDAARRAYHDVIQLAIAETRQKQ